jgi:hypothetical protein
MTIQVCAIMSSGSHHRPARKKSGHSQSPGLVLQDKSPVLLWGHKSSKLGTVIISTDTMRSVLK